MFTSCWVWLGFSRGLWIFNLPVSGSLLVGLIAVVALLAIVGRQNCPILLAFGVLLLFIFWLEANSRVGTAN